jgi:5-methylcytosine-specific restriction protein A
VASRICTYPRCPEIVEGGGRCPEHERDADRARGTATQRGYTSAAHRRFRAEVLAKNDGICALCQLAPATVADHWPLSRRELEHAGHNPDDPRHGRPLCAPCHGTATAQHQPGGWHAGQL